MLQIHDPVNSEKPSQISIGTLQHINFGSIAKVCETDLVSVDIILKEIVAQLKHQVRSGASVKLDFKVGTLTSNSGMIKWKPKGSESARPKEGQSVKSISNKSFASQNCNSMRELISVATPSIFDNKSFHNSSKNLTNNYHMSNPNP